MESQKLKNIKLLYVEDDAIDVMAFERHFVQQNDGFDCEIARTIESAFDLLRSETNYDVIISDYQLPDGQALEILNEVKQIPVIIVTGAGDEKLAVTALKKGAYDYITKDSSSGYLTMLPHTIEKALAHAEDKLRLRVSELRYHKLIESANDVIFECNAGGEFLFANGLAKTITGYAPEELVGTTYTKLVVPETKNLVIEHYKNQFEQKLAGTYLEFEILRKDNTKLWIGQNVTTLFDESHNEVTGYLGVVRDISLKKEYELRLESVNTDLEREVAKRTEKLSAIAVNLTNEVELRQVTEKKLRTSRQSYIDLFNNVNEAIIVFDPIEEIIIEANTMAFKLYGYTRKEFIGISLSRISTDSKIRKKLIDGINNGAERVMQETTHLDSKGNSLFIEVNATPVNYAGKKVILIVNRNLTRRKLAEKQLEIERKKSILSLIEGQEIERKRLSRDLHDGLGQLLFAIKLHVKKLSNSKNLIGKDRFFVGEITDILEMTIVETRQIYQNLLPSTLADFGLEVAMKQIIKVMRENSDSKITYKFHGKAVRLESDVEVGIYRIAQEAINNSNKHSDAENIWVTLEMTDNKIQLIIRDNGVGIETNGKKNTNVMDQRLSHGMNNMKQRAEILGLDLEICTDQESGTSIKLTGNID
jgi:PAS domain S-box-containing protein